MFGGVEVVTESQLRSCNSLAEHSVLAARLVDQAPRMDWLNFHSQLINSLTNVPNITERHNRDIVTLFLDLMDVEHDKVFEGNARQQDLRADDTLHHMVRGQLKPISQPLAHAAFFPPPESIDEGY